jgi:oligoendopeptidase F
MEAFFGAFKPYERTLGMTLYAQLKQDAVYSKVRRYDNSLARALDRDRVPVAVFDTLIAEAHAGLPTLHRYFRLRAKMLGLAQLQYYDVHAPLAQGDFVFPLARGRVLLLEAVAPLGKEYVDALSKGLDSRWMDAYPRPRKQSGAHMSDNAFDVHPYLLMNYTGNYESVTTLAHEWGHAMHSVLAAGAQPYVTGNYTVFVAEIASSLNEGLLLDRVLKSAKSDDERLFYLASALEGLRGMFFMQAMSAEFERDIHAVVDGGEPLTGEALSKAFCENLKRYLGTGEGIVGVDDRYCIGWAAIEQLYSPFYVYQYATSLAASAQFGKQIVAGEPGAQKRYLDLLRAGGSDDPYVLVKRAGVDLATPAPYRALVAQMNGYLDEIEAILARRR